MTTTMNRAGAAAATVATVLVLGAAGAGRDCTATDCSGAFVLLALPFLLFPVLAGAFVAGDDRSAGARWFAAAATGGTAALAMALATFLALDGGDDDRSFYVFGWIAAAPVATALAIPLVAAGQTVASAEAPRRTERLLRLLVVGGAFLILAGALMPWTAVEAGSATFLASGFGGGRWGLATSLCAVIVVAAVASEATRASAVAAASAAVAIAIAGLVVVAPSVHARPPSGVGTTRSGTGPFVTLAGGIVALGATVTGARTT